MCFDTSYYGLWPWHKCFYRLCYRIWVSEWVSERYLTPNEQFFSCNMSRNFFYQTNTLSWIAIVHDIWNNMVWVNMSLHLDTLFWFRANQSLLFFPSVANLVEKHQMSIVFGLTRPKIERIIYSTRGGHPNHYTIDAIYRIYTTHLISI
jgi:hypothetical protein